MAFKSLQNELPPQNIEAEKAVLGSIFLNKNVLIDVMGYISADDFYSHANKLIFSAMVDLSNRNEAIDILTVNDLLAVKNQLEDIGGASYLDELAASVPTTANVGYYAKIVQQKSMARKLIQTANDIIKKSYLQEEDVNSLLENSEQDIMKIVESKKNSDFRSLDNVLTNNLNKIDELSKGNSDITGLSTGYPALDSLTTGLHDNELIILAARPSVGKTAFALNIAQNVGTKTDKSIAIFSLEMSAESLANRMLCAEGNIDSNHLKTGHLTDEEWNNLMVAASSLAKTNIYIDDSPGIKMAEVRAKCRQLVKENKNLGLVIVDYLQLIEGTHRENRQQEVAEISRQLKQLANELNVPVIALSQLSRGVEQRQDKRPMLSDLRESGSIEQDADIVAFLYREDYYDKEEDKDSNENQDVGEVEVLVEKNRSGPRGMAKLLFIKPYNKFSSLSYREQ